MMTMAIAAALSVATNLPTVVVEASRVGKTPITHAQYVETIDERQIVRSDAKNLPDLLARHSGVNLYHLGAGNPALAQIQMRGYGENGFGRVLVVVDGEYLNNFDMTSTDLSRLPFGAIRRVEIHHGPQSVLYGDAASAGLISVSTDTDGYETKTYGEIHGGSWGAVGVAAGTRGGFEDEGVAYSADFGYDRADGYRANSDYDLWNARAGLRKNFANGAFVRISSFFSTADYELPGPLAEDVYRHDPTASFYHDRARITSFGINLSAHGVIDEENALDFIFTFSQRHSHYTNDDDAGGYTYLRDYESDLWDFRFAPQYECTAELFGFKNSFIFGGELRYDRLRGRAADSYPDFGFESCEHPACERWTAGTFAQEEFWLLRTLSASVGARLSRDWNQNELLADSSRQDNLVAGEAALNYHPVDAAKVFLRWCRFYRNPFADEYRWRDGQQSGTAHPETGWDVEVGGRWDLTDEWFVSAVAYYSETEDEIHYNPFAMSNENSPWLHRREGLDLACGWWREKVAGLSCAWSGVHAVKAGGDYKGNWVPGVPRQQLDVEGRVWLGDEFSVSLGYRLIGAHYAISDTPNANGRISAANIFRIGCRYEPTRWGLKGLSFSFSCENLFDENYCDYAVASVTSGENAWYPAAGRAFQFTVRYEF